jgi:hypothetical protein
MTAFVISINGQRIGTIGVGDNGSLGASVHWTGSEGEVGDVGVNYGGIDARTDEHVNWPWPPELKIGDVVSIQIIESEDVDAPRERKTPAQMAEEDRARIAAFEASRESRLA